MSNTDHELEVDVAVIGAGSAGLVAYGKPANAPTRSS